VPIVELIVAELRRRAEMLAALFVVPGQIVIHVDPGNKSQPVRLEVRVKV